MEVEGRDTEVELAGFGFDAPESDAWVDLVRSAEARRSLGSLGPYELLELVGRGGQGVVFRARHSESGRIQALKRLHEGRFADENALRRLEREVEAASALDHPGIVKVDGQVELFEDQPVVVMEWVRGTPVTEWVASNRPLRPLDDVLQLFLSIAGAVAHAHEHGVIHRDLKPSNILVDAQGRPRLMDFGLAKLKDAEGSTLTLDGQFVGTLAYAAPEQLRESSGVDERADVYSLGAVLFELLTGRVPLLVEGSPADHLQTVLEGDPERPSSLRPLSRDVDAVLLKALARNPGARYSSVATFAADVEHLLAGRAVEARPPSRLFSAQRFVRRNRWPVALAASITLLSLAFGAWAWRQSQLLRGERDVAAAASDRATRGEERAHAVLDFFIDELFASDSTAYSTADALELAATRLRYTQHDDPAVLAAKHLAVGRLAMKLERLDVAEANLSIASERMDALQGVDHPDARSTRCELGWAKLELGQWDAAREILLPISTSEDETGLRALHGLAKAAWLAGDSEEAQRRFTEGTHLAGRLGNGSGRTPTELSLDLASFLVGEGRGDEARAELQRLVERFDALFSQPDPVQVVALHELGLHAYRVGDLDEAIASFERALEIQKQTVGETHPIVGTLLAELGKVYLTADEPELGLERIRSGLELAERTWGEDHHNVLTIQMLLAAALMANERLSEAERLCRDVVARRESRFGESDQHVIYGNLRLAEVLAAAGEFDESAALLDAVIPELRERRSESLDQALFTFSDCLDQLGLLEEAEEILGEALEVALPLRGERPQQVKGLYTFGEYAAERGDYQEAARRYGEALDMDRRVAALSPEEFGVRLLHRAEYTLAAGDPDQALERLEGARAWIEEHPPTDPFYQLNCELLLGHCRGALGEVEEARDHLQAALALCTRDFPDRADYAAEIESALAGLPGE